MLNLIDYQNLWTVTLANPIHTLPCYYQYLQREVYFQDYLDLFGHRAMPTYPRIGANLVAIPGLIPDLTGVYTCVVGGVDYLRVDYPFPFLGQLGNGRTIKYILIGEAPPVATTYFYNINHSTRTLYFSQPYAAFVSHPVGLTKQDKLVELADQGVLILDLSTFGISYDQNLRKRLGRIFGLNVLAKLGVLNPLLDPGCDFCLIAPLKTSEGFINWLLLPPNLGVLHRMPLAHRNDMLGAPSYVDARGRTHIHYTSNPAGGHLSKRAKMTAPIGLSGPTAAFLLRAF
jgi:hypothetical protein